jgi:hypothetical protein
MVRPTFKINFTEWNKALPPYLMLSRRGRADVLNKKAYYISRRALYETPATPGAVIKSSLGQIRRSKKQIVSMKLTQGRDHNAPLAALIINSRLGKENRKGLYGAAMATAIASFIGARAKSRAFLKSGWLPAIKALKNTFSGSRGGLPPIGAVKQFGRDFGRAIPAKDGVRCQVLIENAADIGNPKSPFHVPTHQPDALIKYGGPALQRAFDNEAASMNAEVMRRIKEDARQSGIKFIAG